MRLGQKRCAAEVYFGGAPAMMVIDGLRRTRHDGHPVYGNICAGENNTGRCRIWSLRRLSGHQSAQCQKCTEEFHFYFCPFVAKFCSAGGQSCARAQATGNTVLDLLAKKSNSEDLT